MDNQNEPQVAGFFDGLSGIARYVRMYFGRTPLASGTCFFVMSADGPVLVTNRHNFTGRNNITGKPLHKQGGIPDHAVVTLHGPAEVYYHIDLVDHANPEAPAWTEHPTLGAKADIVALPVKDCLPNSAVRHPPPASQPGNSRARSEPSARRSDVRALDDRRSQS